jgi:L-alanine-DL-glutamate epimerase-like enolase superfamily enzyme
MGLRGAFKAVLMRHATELDTYENPFCDQLVTELTQLNAGFVALPTSPGLAIEMVEEVIEKYRIR